MTNFDYLYPSRTTHSYVSRMYYVFDFDCVILHSPMKSLASVRLGGGEGWGVVRDSKQMRLLSLCLGRGETLICT